jgi:large subunit ribosomal protein L24
MPSPVAKPHIVKGDTVVLRRGKDKGKRGIVKHVFPQDGVATVEGINVVKRHAKQGVDGAKSPGIYEKEAPIPISALQLIDPKDNHPTRVRHIRKENGEPARVSKRSGEEFLASAKGR